MNIAKNTTSQDIDSTPLYNIDVTFNQQYNATSPTPPILTNSAPIYATIWATYVQGSRVAANIPIIMQLTPPPAELIVFTPDGKIITPDDELGEGRFAFNTDQLGSVRVAFASTNNCYQGVSVYSRDDGTSISNQYEIFFGDYSHATTSIPAPNVQLSEKQAVEILPNFPTFHVEIPYADSYQNQDGYSCVAILNKINFRKMPYTAAVDSTGMDLPVTWLRTTGLNEITYFIENDGSATVATAPNLQFKAMGTPYNHPTIDPSMPRTLLSRPYFSNGQTSITPSNYGSLTICLNRYHSKDIDPNSKPAVGEIPNFNAGDTVTFLMYINGYYPGSLTEKTDYLTFDCIIPNPCLDTVSIPIPSYKLDGYGVKQGGSAGRYDLDYAVIPCTAKDPSQYNRPTGWTKGYINTVGKIG